MKKNCTICGQLNYFTVNCRNRIIDNKSELKEDN